MKAIHPQNTNKASVEIKLWNPGKVGKLNCSEQKLPANIRRWHQVQAAIGITEKVQTVDGNGEPEHHHNGSMWTHKFEVWLFLATAGFGHVCWSSARKIKLRFPLVNQWRNLSSSSMRRDSLCFVKRAPE